MRIGLLANGNSKHTRRWASELTRIGHSVIVFHLGKTKRQYFKKFTEYDDVLIINVTQPFSNNLSSRMLRFTFRKIFGDKYLNRKTAKKLEIKIIGEEIDVLWIFGIQFHGQVASYLNNIPLIIMLAGSDIFHRKKDKKTENEYQQMLRKADLIQSQSKSIIRKAKEDFHFDMGKVRVFPWGVDFKKYPLDTAKLQKSEMKKKLSIPENHFIVLSCRSMLPLYHWKDILHSFLLVKNEPIHLIMIKGLGTEKEIQEAEKFIKLNSLEGRITLIDRFLPFKEMVTLYALSDATISIPETDNLSDVIWETMAFKCIPILARIPAYYEALDEEHAIYLNDRTPHAIAKGIQKAFSSQWNTIIEENFMKAKQNTWEETLRKQVSIFEEAIKAHAEKKRDIN